MKGTFLLFLISILSFGYTRAQKTVYFSTNYLQECWWNDVSGKYEDCKGNEESSLFKLNADQTMFHHTTEQVSSDYYVTRHEYDDKNDVYTYDVKSDVGNTYYFVVDVKNNQIRIVGNNKSSGSKTYMNVYTIKKSWTE